MAQTTRKNIKEMANVLNAHRTSGNIYAHENAVYEIVHNAYDTGLYDFVVSRIVVYATGIYGTIARLDCIEYKKHDGEIIKEFVYFD